MNHTLLIKGALPGRPVDRVHALVRYAQGNLHTGPVLVNLMGATHPLQGRARGGMDTRDRKLYSRMVRGVRRYSVKLRIGPDSAFPLLGHSYPGLKTTPVYDLLDWEEALVLLAAHEFMHCQQYRQGMPRSEIQAEITGLSRLTAFRAARAAGLI